MGKKGPITSSEKYHLPPIIEQLHEFFKLLAERFKGFVTNRQDLLSGSIFDVSGCS